MTRPTLTLICQSSLISLVFASFWLVGLSVSRFRAVVCNFYDQKSHFWQKKKKKKAICFKFYLFSEDFSFFFFDLASVATLWRFKPRCGLGCTFQLTKYFLVCRLHIFTVNTASIINASHHVCSLTIYTAIHNNVYAHTSIPLSYMSMGERCIYCKQYCVYSPVFFVVLKLLY